MYGPDKEHTVFIIDQKLYCYKVMTFGLKKAGATYQRPVNKMCVDHLGKRWKYTSMACSSKPSS